jgi:NAD-dependent oxidoreductase involved in siderophore biosynthesis
MTINTGVDISKVNVYSASQEPDGVNISKLNVYSAVLGFTGVALTKITIYSAVNDLGQTPVAPQIFVST